jgi:uncharacterized protein YjlB
MISLEPSSPPPQKEAIIKLYLKSDGRFPNNEAVPLVLHRGLVSATNHARMMVRTMDACFTEHGWHTLWQGSLYNVHHYHAATHEAIGVVNGSATLQFGGPQGPEITVHAGDAVMIPAGVAHCLKSETPGFLVHGAYPSGCEPDMYFGEPHERPDVDRQIKKAPLPSTHIEDTQLFGLSTPD